MKTKMQRTTFKTALTALLAACLLASSANAQLSALEGKFSLPHEAHWGTAVLPAGDYLLSIRTTGSPTILTIQDAKTGRWVAMVAPQFRRTTTARETALLISARGSQRVIHSFRVAELGVVFISEPALAREQSIGEDAGETQIVPVIMAKK
jgi:hypothetical protein